MLSSEEQMHIIKSAIAEGYKGKIFKLIDQANVEKGAVAQTQEQQEQGLKGSDGNTAMSFPNSDQNFNTKGMDFDLDIRKYDKEGNLVKSYQKVPPGIKSLNMGEEEGTVIETPSQYQDGGFEGDWNGSISDGYPDSNRDVSIQVKDETERRSKKEEETKTKEKFYNEYGETPDWIHKNIFPKLETTKKKNEFMEYWDGVGRPDVKLYNDSDPAHGNTPTMGSIAGKTFAKNRNGFFNPLDNTIYIHDKHEWNKNAFTNIIIDELPHAEQRTEDGNLKFFADMFGGIHDQANDSRNFKEAPKLTNAWNIGQYWKNVMNPDIQGQTYNVDGSWEHDAHYGHRADKVDKIFNHKKGGYRRKQYQDAGFIGPQLPPGYVAPEKKVVEPKPEPVVEKKVNKVVKPKVVKKKTKTNNNNYSTDRPKSSKDIKELQTLLISEGFDVGKTGADGSWGDNTQKAFDKYRSRTDAKEIGWLDRLRGINSKIHNQGLSQSVQTYAQYAGNALLQGYGLVGEDESYFDVTEKDLRPDEIATYKSILRDNFNKGRSSKIDYRGYSNDPEIANAPNSEEARKLLEAKGISSTILNDWNPLSGTNATKEALHTLTGNASYNIDKDGNVYVQDNYDFNYSQNKKGLKTGTTISELYKHATANKYDGSGYDNAHSVGDQVKSRIPVNINLGSATDLGLTPNEIAQLGEYNPNASNVKTVSTLELLKRGTKKVFGFQEGGFNPDHIKPTLKFPPQFPQGRIEKGASWNLKKGVRALESSNGVNMKNSKTPATGFYGQFFNQIEDLPIMNGITRDEFAADTTLQNKVFDMRYKGRIPNVPGLKSNVKKLRKDYKELTKDYTDDELAALSNFTGRKRAREYFASIRDGKSFKMPGQDAGDNKSVEQYMKEFRAVVNKKKLGGKRKCKYGCW